MGKKISVSSLNGYRTFSQSRENPGQGKSSSKNPGTSVLVFVGEEADPLICARSAYPLLSLFLKFFLTQLTQTISSSSRSVEGKPPSDGRKELPLPRSGIQGCLTKIKDALLKELSKRRSGSLAERSGQPSTTGYGERPRLIKLIWTFVFSS
uniref:Uncharacterized protein n=1 Tax=Cucumis melo TaxID=3656 RepID=A0A9I9E705_CUCME